MILLYNHRNVGSERESLMPRFFLSRTQFDPESGYLTLRGADAHHLSDVLRMKAGDCVTVSDMQRTDYICRIDGAAEDGVRLVIERICPNETEPPVAIRLFQSLPKGDKMDWIVQKSVELGVTDITPVTSARCIAHIAPDKIPSRTARWQRIAEEAGKQCGRGIVPTVHEPVPFAAALESCRELDYPVFCYEGEGTESLRSVREPIRNQLSAVGPRPSVGFFIGPEGGYDIAEAETARAAGLPLANLGRRILRCETAPLFFLSALLYTLELS